jgi:hypothetical protein
MSEYGNILARVDKVKKTIEALMLRNQELVKANRRLREEIETNLELYKANLRVQKASSS